MECPGCKAQVEPVKPSAGEAVKAVVLDWRTWAFSFGVSLVTGLVIGGLGIGGQAGAGAGAVVGLFVALRIGAQRACPSCRTVFVPPAARPAS